MSPVIVVDPVLVMVLPARTAKLSAVPRPTVASAERTAEPTARLAVTRVTATIAVRRMRLRAEASDD
jgi:hypothetical protein